MSTNSQFNLNQPILSKSQYPTKVFSKTPISKSKEPIKNLFKAHPKIKVKKYCDFLEIALQDLIQQSDEITEKEIKDLKQSRLRRNSKHKRMKKELTQTRDQMNQLNQQKGWFVDPKEKQVKKSIALSTLHFSSQLKVQIEKPGNGRNMTSMAVGTEDKQATADRSNGLITQVCASKTSQLPNKKSDTNRDLNERQSDESREESPMAINTRSVYDLTEGPQSPAAQSPTSMNNRASQDVQSLDQYSQNSPKRSMANLIKQKHQNRVKSAHVTRNYKHGTAPVHDRYRKSQKNQQPGSATQVGPSIKNVNMSVYFQQMYQRNSGHQTFVENKRRTGKGSSSFYFRSSRDIDHFSKKSLQAAIMRRDQIQSCTSQAFTNILVAEKPKNQRNNILQMRPNTSKPAISSPMNYGIESANTGISLNKMRSTTTRFSMIRSPLSDKYEYEPEIEKPKKSLSPDNRETGSSAGWKPIATLHKHRSLYLKSCKNKSIQPNEKILKNCMVSQSDVSSNLLAEIRNYKLYKAVLA